MRPLARIPGGDHGSTQEMFVEMSEMTLCAPRMLGLACLDFALPYHRERLAFHACGSLTHLSEENSRAAEELGLRAAN